MNNIPSLQTQFTPILTTPIHPPIPSSIHYERLGSRVVSFNYCPNSENNFMHLIYPIYIDYDSFRKNNIQLHSANLLRLIHILVVGSSSSYVNLYEFFDEQNINVYEIFGSNIAFIFTKSNLFPVGSRIYITGTVQI